MDRELTFGEKAVGLTFNPGGNELVNHLKAEFAKLIDEVHNHRSTSEDGEVKRMCAVAITELQTAQMWAVKAVTWEA